MRRTFLKLAVSAAALIAVAPIPASAQSLIEKAKAGDPIRIGFANEVP
jgi:hypothetical protein